MSKATVTVFFRPKGATYEPYQTQVDGYIALEALAKGLQKMGYEIVKREGDQSTLPGWTKAEVQTDGAVDDLLKASKMVLEWAENGPSRKSSGLSELRIAVDKLEGK